MKAPPFVRMAELFAVMRCAGGCDAREERNKMKKLGIGAGIFLGTLLVCAGLLVLTACIPQERIADACRESASFFQERELFPILKGEQFNLRQDNYADCIQVNILYHMGTQKESLFSSAMRAAYYQEEGQEVTDALQEAVTEEKTPNVDYLRYWHGSLVLLRPLFLLTDIAGARMVLGWLTLLLMLGTAAALTLKRRTELAVCYILSYAAVNGFMGMFCVEYVTTFLLMAAISLIVVLTSREEDAAQVRGRTMLLLMIVSGAVTCFLDFLTTETLTFTIPVFLELALRCDTRSFRSRAKEVLIWGIGWLCSYAGMFLAKWLLALGMFGGEAFREALLSAKERVDGAVYLGNTNLDAEASVLQRYTGALGRNITALFPFSGEVQLSHGVLIFLLILAGCFAVIYLFRAKDFKMEQIGMFLLLGLLPYGRYLVLGSHSYQHYFFTYRAQMVTVLALLYVTWRWGIRGQKKTA